MFPAPSLWERIKNSFFVGDRNDMLEKVAQNVTGQWEYIHRNLESVDITNLERYKSDLLDLRMKLMTKVEAINAQILDLQAHNLGNSAQIVSLGNWMYDIEDEIIPINIDINEVTKAIATKTQQ